MCAVECIAVIFILLGTAVRSGARRDDTTRTERHGPVTFVTSCCRPCHAANWAAESLSRLELYQCHGQLLKHNRPFRPELLLVPTLPAPRPCLELLTGLLLANLTFPSSIIRHPYATPVLAPYAPVRMCSQSGVLGH
jgi:hypothetical protein